jgi:hypothetical protein
MATDIVVMKMTLVRVILVTDMVVMIMTMMTVMMVVLANTII